MKAVVETVVGPSPGHLSAATCGFESSTPVRIGSGSSIDAYLFTHEGEVILVEAKTPAIAQRPLSTLLQQGLAYYYFRKEVTLDQEARFIVRNPKMRVATCLFDFPSPGIEYRVWTPLSAPQVEVSESTEKTSTASEASGATTADESLLALEGVQRATPAIGTLSWRELALAAFPQMRGLTAMEAAAYKAFKKKFFRPKQ